MIGGSSSICPLPLLPAIAGKAVAGGKQKLGLKWPIPCPLVPPLPCPSTCHPCPSALSTLPGVCLPNTLPLLQCLNPACCCLPPGAAPLLLCPHLASSSGYGSGSSGPNPHPSPVPSLVTGLKQELELQLLQLLLPGWAQTTMYSMLPDGAANEGKQQQEWGEAEAAWGVEAVARGRGSAATAPSCI